MNKLEEMVDWGKIGWWAVQGTIGCGLVLVGLTFLMGTALGVFAVWDEMIQPLVDMFGLYLLPVPPTLFALLYLGWYLAGKIIDTWAIR